MEKKLDFTIIEVNLLKNLVTALVYLGFWYFLIAETINVQMAIFQFVYSFIFFVALDNLWRFVKWVIDSL